MATRKKADRNAPRKLALADGLLLALALVPCTIDSHLQSQEQQTKAPGHYLFAWTGDAALKGKDFLAVIDADPASRSYGQLMTTIATDQQTVRVHHTEYVMPASGMLFANDHDAGRTFIFDVRDPPHPKIVTSFTDMAGYMHPCSYLRLPNGQMLVTFQHLHHGESEEQMGGSGGLVEIDHHGKVIRSSSSADPAFPGALLTPYSLVVLPEIDRVVSTVDGLGESIQRRNVPSMAPVEQQWFNHAESERDPAGDFISLTPPD